ncbi:Spy/CpxP family protein refolding chaperone [Ancylobacter radicis]|uniref:Spy/CpxP family protein refolding chaperone n=1 Tax=Ancylobacter radicis TaxID=2836179 RepID=A0ABS5RDI9_9HYPH|nr:Spy/CpxP family protein refolding chaperone [Ancylobacter radicis]MBS9479147.1 Spy/CpxP family protein refolding chaperone [Ancylobacter radicis]
MKRTIIAATAAALLASVAFGVAAPNLRGDGPRPTPQQMAENAGAMSDARIAALKAGLKLTPDQEKLWPALEAALRDSSQQRIDRRLEHREERAEKGPDDRPDVIERLRERADGMLERGEALKKVADAADPLFKTLDDQQKHRFAILFKQAEGPRMARHDGPRGPHGFGPGRHGPDGPGHHRMPPGPMPGGPDGPGAPDDEPL